MSEQKRSILIVDDEAVNLQILDSILSPLYRILAARSGADAIAIFEQQRPDAVLLDAMMPEMDGYEVCRRLRAEKANHDLPVIFVTARDELPDEEDAFHAGATDFITKPIDPEQLIASLQACLK